jgi:hypothetical protein
VLHNPSERKLRVLWRLRQAAREIIEAARKPWIVLAHAVHAESDEFVREEFGERRSDGLKMRMRRNEVNVGLNSETRRGKDAIAAERMFA